MSNPIASNSSTDLGALEARLGGLEREVASIMERNRRVESNKSWETSRLRLCAITAITYVTMTLICIVLGSNRSFLDALVPTAGFFLSTLSLSFLRAAYEKAAEPKGDRLD